MFLHEKNIDFIERVVDLHGGETKEPWFFRLNPLGEVPVLKDGVKVISDSDKILEYLEDNFRNGKIRKKTLIRQYDL